VWLARDLHHDLPALWVHDTMLDDIHLLLVRSTEPRRRVSRMLIEQHHHPASLREARPHPGHVRSPLQARGRGKLFSGDGTVRHLVRNRCPQRVRRRSQRSPGQKGDSLHQSFQIQRIVLEKEGWGQGKRGREHAAAGGDGHRPVVPDCRKSPRSLSVQAKLHLVRPVCDSLPLGIGQPPLVCRGQGHRARSRRCQQQQPRAKLRYCLHRLNPPSSRQGRMSSCRTSFIIPSVMQHPCNTVPALSRRERLSLTRVPTRRYTVPGSARVSRPRPCAL